LTSAGCHVLEQRREEIHDLAQDGIDRVVAKAHVGSPRSTDWHRADRESGRPTA